MLWRKFELIPTKIFRITAILLHYIVYCTNVLPLSLPPLSLSPSSLSLSPVGPYLVIGTQHRLVGIINGHEIHHMTHYDVIPFVKSTLNLTQSQVRDIPLSLSLPQWYKITNIKLSTD